MLNTSSDNFFGEDVTPTSNNLKRRMKDVKMEDEATMKFMNGTDELC